VVQHYHAPVLDWSWPRCALIRSGGRSHRASPGLALRERIPRRGHHATTRDRVRARDPQSARREVTDMPKIFFATDLHGSEVCWKKFLIAAKFYEADVLICGGDMMGKAIVPIVSENGHYTVALGGEREEVTADQVGEVEANIRRKGYYPLRMSVERLHELDQDPAKRAECFQ